MFEIAANISFCNKVGATGELITGRPFLLSAEHGTNLAGASPATGIYVTAK